MLWTRKPPTVDGYYYWRPCADEEARHPGRKLQIVEVVRGNVYATGMSGSYAVELRGGEWAPVPMPEPRQVTT